MRTRLVVFATVLSLWPASAYAARGFWAWLEELSGPGPFKGVVFSTPVACVDEGGFKNCGELRTDRSYQRILFEVGRFDSDGNLRFQDLPDTPENRENVNVLFISGSYMFRFFNAVEVGPGVGFMRFSGKGFDPMYRAALTPVRAAVQPFLLVKRWRGNRLAHVLRYEIEEVYLTKGFTGADFGNTTTRFSTRSEFLLRHGFVVDLGELIW